ncbi:MAG TPA: DUF3795 domain-containing protein [Ruminococcaceae bacterium]|nr:DUF3795 domain-containing protein [Oscillospiraceae bacterium]
MNKEKGIAYCGLACCACGQNQSCAGCRNDGCTNKQWCKNFNCCKQKGLNGCWECDEFPCSGGMLEKTRIRAFAKFIKDYGEEKIISCLERNEADGVVYHHKGKLTGDYDNFKTEQEIIDFILNGKKPAEA